MSTNQAQDARTIVNNPADADEVLQHFHDLCKDLVDLNKLEQATMLAIGNTLQLVEEHKREVRPRSTKRSNPRSSSRRNV